MNHAGRCVGLDEARLCASVAGSLSLINAYVLKRLGPIKESGYGRELSEFGIYKLCTIKTVPVQEWSRSNQHTL